MRILVTGSNGYIGTQLCQILDAAGHSVVGLDTGFYNSAWLYNGISNFPPVIPKDIRKVSEINHKGSVNLAKKAKAAGVGKFIYMSSCSAYGIAKNGVATEEAEVHPQTYYAKCKILSEKDISKLASNNFSPVFLQSATVFGTSPRMRFDIVLNNLAGLAWTEKEIVMHSDGTPWRPLIHILYLYSA